MPIQIDAATQVSRNSSDHVLISQTSVAGALKRVLVSVFATAAQGAKADSAVQPADIDTLAELNSVLTDATLVDGGLANVVEDTTPQLGGNLDTQSFTVDGRDVSADGTKLDGIEASATADQSAAEILTAIKTVDGTGSGLDADLLDGLQASAFATAAQGSTADSALQAADINTLAELNAIVADATLGTAADFATAAQGSTADSALQAADINTLAELNAIVADATLVDGALANVVEDTTPQLGGNLDTQSFTVDGRDVSVDGSKLDGIEAGSTADQSNAEIRAAVEAATDSNVFTDADHTKLDGVESSATADQTATEIGVAVHLVGLDAAKPAAASGNNGVLYLSTDVNGGTLYRSNGSTWVQAGGGVTSSGMANVVEDTSPQLGANLDTQSFTVDGRDVSVDGTKLDGVEAGATADQSNAEIRAAVEAATDSNVFTDADHTKLNGIEASADVTDATNVTSAGALMDSELTDIAAVKALSDASIAVTDTGTSTTAFVTPAGLAGSALQTKVNGIEAAADVTDATNVNAAGATMNTDASVAGNSYFLDEDTLSSNSATQVASQQSIKAYVDSATGGHLSNVVEDTSPQLGGMLDVNGNAIGDGTRELLTFTEDVSAVNQVNVENQAAGGGPIIRASGDDANVDLNFESKGTGNIKFADDTDVTGTLAVTGAITVTSTVDGRDVATDGSKLDGIASSATANSADATLLARANHTGTQPLSTISDSGALAALATVGSGQIDDEAVTHAKLAHMATDSFLGRTTAGTGDVETLSASQARTVLNVADGAEVNPTEAWTVALGDETTAITTGTAKVTFRTPYTMTVTGVRASLTTASSSGIPTFDINEGGSTILTTKLTIDANEKTSTTAVTAAVIGGAGPVLADDAEITIDVDVAGLGAAGAKITLLYTR